MRTQAAATLVLLGFLCWPPAAEAGVFLGTSYCTLTAACSPGTPASNGSVIINPYGIVHPATFVPGGGILPTVKICVGDVPGSNLARAAEWAAAK
jgi:hypothetical protein